MQELIGNMTVEQFTQFMGFIVAYLLFIFGSCILVFSFVGAIVDGWLYRKGALYYGSLRYLNKCFKKLKSASTQRELDFIDVELRSTIHLLRYQRVISKIMFDRLLEKQEAIYSDVYFNLRPF